MAVAEKRTHPPDRPRSVTFVAWGVFILGAANLWRAFGYAHQRDLYQLLGIKPDSSILLALSLIWAAALIAASLAIWLRWPPIRIVLPVVMGSYGLYQLGVQAVFTKSEVALQGRVAFALLYGAAALTALWALNRHAGRRFLIGKEEE